MQREGSIHERLADRLVSIITKLSEGEQLNTKELAAEFKVSTRTISRDFDRFSACLPLLKDEVSKKYYLDSKYLGKITQKDIVNLVQRSGINHLYPSLDVSYLRALLDRRTQQVYSIKAYPAEDVSQFKALFDGIAKAIQEYREISFLYKSERRRVYPYRLIHHHGNWYLAAVHKDKLRAYRLTRIERSTLQNESVYFKPDSTILSQLDDEKTIWFGQDKFEIILTAHVDVASYFQARSLLPEQQIIEILDDGSLLLSSQIKHVTQILPLVRYWIPHLRIVSPEGLQTEMENELKQYLNI